MLLTTPITTLGPVDHQALRAAVAGVKPEAWLEDTTRQKSFEQHIHTQSIIIVFASNWPSDPVTRRHGWDYLAGPAVKLVDQIVAAHYPRGGSVIRAMAAKLLAGGEIKLHKDGHPSFAVAHRIHVPLETNPDVDFEVRGENFHLLDGIAYEISNLDYHAVKNRSDRDRIHFIFDYVPPQ